MKQLLFFLAAMLFITSCKVAFVPQRDQSVLGQISAGQHTTDSVYDAMLSSNDKTYQSFENGYAMIAVDIAFLQTTESLRNKTIASQVDILQKHFTFYMNQHKTKGSLTNAEISTYKNDLDAYWQPIYASENFLK